MSTIARNTITIAVTKNVTKGSTTVREPVGSVEVYAPTLAEFGLAVEPVSQNEETGELTYAAHADQFLYNAVLAQVKANARNKMQSGSISLKPNNKFAENLQELITPSESTSTVLAERRALFELFKDYLSNLARPENVKRLLLTFLEKPETLALQPAEQRAKIKVYFDEFGGSVEEKLTQWQGDYLINTIAQCDAEEVDF